MVSLTRRRVAIPTARILIDDHRCMLFPDEWTDIPPRQHAEWEIFPVLRSFRVRPLTDTSSARAHLAATISSTIATHSALRDRAGPPRAVFS